MERFVYTIAVSKAEYEQAQAIKEAGASIVSIFRKGLATYNTCKQVKQDTILVKPDKPIKVGKPVVREYTGGQYGCGCDKVAGQIGCLKHGGRQ